MVCLQPNGQKFSWFVDNSMDRSFHGLLTIQWTEVFMVCLQPNGQKFSWFLYKPVSRTEVFMVCLQPSGQKFSWFVDNPMDKSFHGLFTTY